MRSQRDAFLRFEALEPRQMLSVTTLTSRFGDFNQDQVVDTADYTVWRDAAGQTVDDANRRADATGDGVIDASDYRQWRARFGTRLNPAPQLESVVATRAADGGGSEIVFAFDTPVFRLLAGALAQNTVITARVANPDFDSAPETEPEFIEALIDVPFRAEFSDDSRRFTLTTDLPTPAGAEIHVGRFAGLRYDTGSIPRFVNITVDTVVAESDVSDAEFLEALNGDAGSSGASLAFMLPLGGPAAGAPIPGAIDLALAEPVALAAPPSASPLTGDAVVGASATQPSADPFFARLLLETDSKGSAPNIEWGLVSDELLADLRPLWPLRNR